MEPPRTLVVLLGPWPPPPNARQRELLHRLVEDLNDEVVYLLLGLPWGPWIYHRPHHLDPGELDFWLYHAWRHYPDWPRHYPEWREDIARALRTVDEGHVVVLLPAFVRGERLDAEALRDLAQVVQPAALVSLGLDEEDRTIADRLPNVEAFNYPKDREEFRRFLRAYSRDRPLPMAAPGDRRAARYALERQEFADRTKDQERPKITAAYPEAIASSGWSSVDIFLYLKDYRELVQKEIRGLQDREGLDYSGVSAEFPKSLPPGCPVKISVLSESLHINPSELTIKWFEPYNRLPFRISPVDGSRDNYSASLDIDVHADDLPVASMRLAIAVNSTARAGRLTAAESEAAWYENIFASYAREDLALVKHLKERYEALGLYMFIDLDDLRAGTSWQPALFKHIDQSDLFQLFWSQRARQSDYVTLEWKHALQLRDAKGTRFIRPVYWEEPMPAVPRELGEINFRRIPCFATQD